MKLLFRKGMHLAKRKVRRLGVTRNWLLAYIVLIVLPVSVLLYSYYQRFSSILEEEVTRTMQQAIKQAGINLTYRLGHLQDISNAAFMNPNLHQVIGSGQMEASVVQQLQAVQELRNMIASVQTNTDVFRVRLFVDRSKLYANERINFFALDSLAEKPWYPNIIAANGGIVWTEVYRESFIDQEDEYLISGARMLRDPNQYDRAAGVLMIDVRETLLTGILSDLQFTPQALIYVVDEAGKIVFHPDKALIGTAARAEVREAVLKEKEGSARKIYDHHESEYVMSATIPPANWKLVAVVPTAEISPRAVRQSLYSGIVALLVLIALFVVLVFVLILFIVNGTNRRVRQVIGMIRKEEADGLEDSALSADGDLNLLERGVDRLIYKIRMLVQQTYKERVLKREAELRALQAQINPHFLYNALDAINWMAIGRGAHDISRMIDALAKYFRLSLNKGRDMVSVQDELELAKAYLDIQRNRFSHAFEFRIESEPQLESLIVPKLTLQPIVENALLHGILPKKDKRGTIAVTARKEGNDLVLSVEDDGVGIEEERLRQLLAGPPSRSGGYGSGSSYGLYNVNERIRLYAGGAYGLHIQSQPGAGTTVTVRLKAAGDPPDKLAE